MRFLTGLYSLILVPALMAQTQTYAPVNQRLAAIGHLWSRVKWIHPALARGNVNWDKALVDALPKIQAAKTSLELKAALEGFMAPLKDPALRVGEAPAPMTINIPADQATVEWLSGDVALLHLHRRGPLSPWNPKRPAVLKALSEALPRAKALVFDLRSASDEGPASNADDFLKTQVAGLIGEPLRLPANRYRYHSGFKSEASRSSKDYFSGMLSLEAERVVPSKQAKPLPMVFIVNEGSGIPSVALALQHAGTAWIVGEGQPSPAWVVPTEAIPIEGTLTVEFSTGELVHADGTIGFGVDATAPSSKTSGPETPSVLVAQKLIHGETRPGASVSWSKTPVIPMAGQAPDYPEATYPDLPWRQLAVIKLWSVVENFFPYKQLMDRPWGEALPVFLGRMQTVKDGREYSLALAEMATTLQDSHVGVYNAEMSSYLGAAPTSLRLAQIEGHIAISAMVPDSAPGLSVGDVVVRVDGEEDQARLQRLRKVLPASTEGAGVRAALMYFLAGPEGSSARIEAKGANGQMKTVELARSKGNWGKIGKLRSGPVFRVLPGNIAYADLDRLEQKDVDAFFEAAKETRAMVLDMRGYPNGTAWSIAPRLNIKGAKVGASFRRNLVTGRPSEGDISLAFDQKLPTTDKALYRGKVVMLINQETISQAEHTGLFFESVCDVTFVGSPTTGANGDVTVMMLPGGVMVPFTGHDVRHVDGRQLQRVGLQPHIPVAPTLDGLRSGKDEVLDRALEFIRTGQ